MNIHHIENNSLYRSNSASPINTEEINHSDGQSKQSTEDPLVASISGELLFSLSTEKRTSVASQSTGDCSDRETTSLETISMNSKSEFKQNINCYNYNPNGTKIPKSSPPLKQKKNIVKKNTVSVSEDNCLDSPQNNKSQNTDLESANVDISITQNTRSPSDGYRETSKMALMALDEIQINHSSTSSTSTPKGSLTPRDTPTSPSDPPLQFSMESIPCRLERSESAASTSSNSSSNLQSFSSTVCVSQLLGSQGTTSHSPLHLEAIEVLSASIPEPRDVTNVKGQTTFFSSTTASVIPDNPQLIAPNQFFCVLSKTNDITSLKKGASSECSDNVQPPRVSTSSGEGQCASILSISSPSIRSSVPPILPSSLLTSPLVKPTFQASPRLLTTISALPLNQPTSNISSTSESSGLTALSSSSSFPPFSLSPGILKSLFSFRGIHSSNDVQQNNQITTPTSLLSNNPSSGANTPGATGGQPRLRQSTRSSDVSSTTTTLHQSLEQVQLACAALQVGIISDPRWNTFQVSVINDIFVLYVHPKTSIHLTDSPNVSLRETLFLAIQKDASLVTLLTDLIKSLAGFFNLFLNRLTSNDSPIRSSFYNEPITAPDPSPSQILENSGLSSDPHQENSLDPIGRSSNLPSELANLKAHELTTLLSLLKQPEVGPQPTTPVTYLNSSTASLRRWVSSTSNGSSSGRLPSISHRPQDWQLTSNSGDPMTPICLPNRSNNASSASVQLEGRRQRVREEVSDELGSAKRQCLTSAKALSCANGLVTPFIVPADESGDLVTAECTQKISRDHEAKQVEPLSRVNKKCAEGKILGLEPNESSPDKVNEEDGKMHDLLSSLIRQLSSSLEKDDNQQTNPALFLVGSASGSSSTPNGGQWKGRAVPNHNVQETKLPPSSSPRPASTPVTPNSNKNDLVLSGSILDDLIEALSREHNVPANIQQSTSDLFSAVDRSKGSESVGANHSHRNRNSGGVHWPSIKSDSDGWFDGKQISGKSTLLVSPSSSSSSSKPENIKGVYWSPASNAWFAQWYDSASKKQVHRSFQANRHGFERAKELAIEARMEAIKSGAASIGKKAKSGVCGISWHAAHNSWRATFKHHSPLIPGGSKLYQRSFSINAYGPEQALRMAIEWREQQEKAAKRQDVLNASLGLTGTYGRVSLPAATEISHILPSTPALDTVAFSHQFGQKLRRAIPSIVKTESLLPHQFPSSTASLLCAEPGRVSLLPPQSIEQRQQN